jgi:hypothetical protein
MVGWLLRTALMVWAAERGAYRAVRHLTAGIP